MVWQKYLIEIQPSLITKVDLVFKTRFGSKINALSIDLLYGGPFSLKEDLPLSLSLYKENETSEEIKSKREK